jgi:hypothetical protein
VPTLDLRFADNKSLVDAVTGASLVTFTRASSGTYVDSAGVIQTVATDVARFDHNPATGESLGLLVEEQRTNLLLRSEEFDNASWTKTRSSVTANDTTAPSGSVSADKLVEDTSTNTHLILQNCTVTAAAHTFSVFGKAAGRSFVRLLLFDGAASFNAYFNLSTGAVGNTGVNTTAAITSIGNGWFRCSITATTSAGTGDVAIRVSSGDTAGSDNYTGDGTSGIYLWGAQLEAGAFPTSYIKNVDTAAGVTRSADVASITGSAFSSWYRQDEGSLFVSASAPQPSSGNRRIAFATDGTSNNRVGILFNASNNPQMLVSSGGTTFASDSIAAVTATGPVSIAAAYKVNDFGLSANGSAPTLDASGSVPSTIDRLSIGSSDGSDRINGTIRRLTFWPTRLSNASLQQITQ